MTLPLPVELPALQSSGRLVTAIVAVILHSAFMIFAVNKEGVREASRAYGIQLILSCETLMASTTGTTRGQAKSGRSKQQP